MSLATGATIRVFTRHETMRIKAILITKRNQTRDFLDVAALADDMGPGLQLVLDVVENKGRADLFRRVQHGAPVRSEQNEGNVVKNNVPRWLDGSGPVISKV